MVIPPAVTPDLITASVRLRLRVGVHPPDRVLDPPQELRPHSVRGAGSGGRYDIEHEATQGSESVGGHAIFTMIMVSWYERLCRRSLASWVLPGFL